MRTSLRLPDELAEKIRDKAASEHRSMHATMLMLLEEALALEGDLAASDADEREGRLHDWADVRTPHFKPDFKK